MKTIFCIAPLSAFLRNWSTDPVRIGLRVQAWRSRKPFHLLLFFVLSLVLWLPPVAAQVPQIFGRPSVERVSATARYVFSIPVDSTRLATTADSISRKAIAEGDEKLAWYTRLFASAQANEWQSHLPVPKTTLYQKKDVFESAPYPDVKASYYLLLGQLYERHRDWESMFHYLIAAADWFEKTGWRNVPMAMWYASYLFDIYYRFEDYPTALRFVQIAIAHPDPVTPAKNRTFLLSNMGETYMKLNDLSTAQATFRQAIEQAKAVGDTDYIGIASANYGNTLRLQGRYREALPFLYTDLALNEKTVPENSAITCAYIALCLLHLDSADKVPFYLQKAAQLRKDWNWFSFYPSYYEAWALYHKQRGSYQQQAVYQDSLLALKDSLKRRFSTSLLLTTSMKLKEERRLAELRQKELEAVQVRMVRNVVVGGILLLSLTVVGLLVRKRKKDRERFMTRQRQSEEKLRQAERDLAQYLGTIREKNELIEKLEKGWPQAGEEAGAAAHQLQQLRHTVILTDQDWKTFKQLFEEVYPGFFGRVRQRYLGLTEGDERLLALYKLNLPPKEMAAMLGISTESLRTSRYRLRKKYPLLAEDDEFRQLA